jgi:hypothetical protein
MTSSVPVHLRIVPAALHAGEHIITRAGTRRVVAFTSPEGVWTYGPHGLELADVVCDAWGGEHDLAQGGALDAA